jgi:hypothetical protein
MVMVQDQFECAGHGALGANATAVWYDMVRYGTIWYDMVDSSLSSLLCLLSLFSSLSSLLSLLCPLSSHLCSVPGSTSSTSLSNRRSINADWIHSTPKKVTVMVVESNGYDVGE